MNDGCQLVKLNVEIYLNPRKLPVCTFDIHDTNANAKAERGYR